jgi:hypothetical protein
MRTMVNVCIVVVSMVFYAATAWGLTEGSSNNFFGTGAGASITTGTMDTFVGASAGSANTMGAGNTYVGFDAGLNNISGTNNVFLGYGAGISETGSNKLYIDNCYYTNTEGCVPYPLIYGEFDTRVVSINGWLGITGPANTLLSLVTTSTTGGAGFEFTVPTGGNWYFKGTATNGFKIRDAANGIDVMYLQPETGNVGIGTDSPAYPLEMKSGAYVSTGGVWTNASSREYKDNIQNLSLEEAARTLEGLNPVTFTYKKEVGAQHVGFIAEDVPDLVATQDRKGLSPMDIVAVLTKVVQEQQQTLGEQQTEMKEKDARIERLEKAQKTLETLEAKLTKLEAEMQRLKSMNMTARTPM